jgi:hypothetical protein
MKLSYTIGSTLLGLALLGGCQSHKATSVVRYDEFPKNYESHSTKDIAEAQVAVGNRNDATLRASHFDGNKLNSLGEAKLSSMLKADRYNSPVTVWVDVANDDVAAGRKSAVKAYLKTKGVPDNAVVLKDGPNPTAGSGMSARGLTALEEMHSAGAASSGASASPAPAAK